MNKVPSCGHLCLVLALISSLFANSLQVEMSSASGMSRVSSDTYNLQAQMPSRPIITPEERDKFILAFTILEKIKRDPAILLQKDEILCNLYSDLGSEIIKINFLGKQYGSKNMDEKIDNLSEIRIVPCSINGKEHYAYLILYKNDQKNKIVIYTEEEHLKKQAKDEQEDDESVLSKEKVQKLEKERDDQKNDAVSSGFTKEGMTYFIDKTDMSIKGVLSFLFKVAEQKREEYSRKGKENFEKQLYDELEEMVDAQRFLISNYPTKVEDAIVVKEETNDLKKAQEILDKLIAQNGEKRDNLKADLPRFWNKWQEGKVDEFEPSNSPEDASNEGSPEGLLRLRDRAFTKMISVTGMELTDRSCQETIDDIIRIFTETVEHEWEKYLERMEAEDKESVTTLGRRKIEKLIPTKESFKNISKCLFPTDMYSPDGEGIINENVVKVLTKLKPYLTGDMGVIHGYNVTVESIRNDPSECVKYFKDKNGKIFEFSDNNLPGDTEEEYEPVTLYTSIIHSFAIHTIRGHFPLNENGFPEFSKDETEAQQKRGKSYRYINTLAMMYYWLLIGEKTEYPKSRAEEIIKLYPDMFCDLENRDQLPEHLERIALIQSKKANDKKSVGIWWDGSIAEADTGTTYDEVNKLFLKKGNDVSNEGGDGMGFGDIVAKYALSGGLKDLNAKVKIDHVKGIFQRGDKNILIYGDYSEGMRRLRSVKAEKNVNVFHADSPEMLKRELSKGYQIDFIINTTGDNISDVLSQLKQNIPIMTEKDYKLFVDELLTAIYA